MTLSGRTRRLMTSISRGDLRAAELNTQRLIDQGADRADIEAAAQAEMDLADLFWEQHPDADAVIGEDARLALLHHQPDAAADAAFGALLEAARAAYAALEDEADVELEAGI